MIRSSSVALGWLLASGVCLAQAPAQAPAPPANAKPARTNVLVAEYPRVTDDSRVIFQLKAPQAQRVQADIMATKYAP